MLRGRVLRPLRFMLYVFVCLVNHITTIQLHLLLRQFALNRPRVEPLDLLALMAAGRHLVGVTDRAGCRPRDLRVLVALHGLDLVAALAVAGALSHDVLGGHDCVGGLPLAALVNI